MKNNFNKVIGSPGRENGGRRVITGHKNQTGGRSLPDRREESSWNFLANRFTPNYIQRKQFYPRAEKEDGVCRNSLLAGDGLLQPPKSSEEKERRDRVRKSEGNEEDLRIL
ncbi:hypothetical protein ZOSMA_197G00150 [Zostera marina]|uniref:Uncharacterized protein n=1 Tax=Zostera marina TaxID=29655 RepID=A0A0K9PR11_ZOSMR|nr:hypothetical protein ZOSMA_197G00150 [Zostera marina]